MVYVGLLSAIFSDKVSILQMNSFPFIYLALKLVDIYFQLAIFLDSLFKNLSLTLALNGQLVELLEFLFVCLLFVL